MQTMQKPLSFYKSTTCGRYIDRSEYEEVIEASNKRVYYRQRQQIMEHQFGTLKRQRGFTHAPLRKKENVLGEVGLMFIGYNLKRCITIPGVAELIILLKNRCLRDFKLQICLILSYFEAEENISHENCQLKKSVDKWHLNTK